MQSMQKPKPTDDPHDILVVAPDAIRVAPDPARVTPDPARVGPDLVRIGPNPVQAASAEEEFSSPAPDAVRTPLDPQPRIQPVFRAGGEMPSVDAAFRATAVDEVAFRAAAVEDALVKSRRRSRSSIAKRAMRAVTALLLAGCIGGAAMAWHYHAEAAQRIIAEWAPLFAQRSSQAPEKTGLTAQPTLAAADADTANASPAQPAPQAPAPSLAAATPAAAEPAAAPAAPAPAANAAPATAAAPAAAAPDQSQSLETMARDLASANQEIEQLKASVAQLKASQQQLTALVAEKSAAQNPRAKRSAQPQPPRPGAALAPDRTPVPPSQSRPPRQAAAPIMPSTASAAPNYAPRQVEAQSASTAETLSDPELDSVPRPPMPLR